MHVFYMMGDVWQDQEQRVTLDLYQQDKFGSRLDWLDWPVLIRGLLKTLLHIITTCEGLDYDGWGVYFYVRCIIAHWFNIIKFVKCPPGWPYEGIIKS